MYDILEAFKLLDSIADESEKHEIIDIDILVSKVLNEDNIPSGNKNDTYDDQTLDDWYDFTGTVEGIIENMCDRVNISMSHNPDSLSEYIDFYVYDENGNKKNFLINMRLSDHPQNANAKKIRKREASKISSTYELVSVTVNKNIYHSYHDAITAVRKLIAEKCFK